MNTALTHPPRKHLRSACAALLAALCVCGAAHAKLPDSREVQTIRNPYSPDCVDVEIVLRLSGLTPDVGDDLFFSFTVTQGGVSKTFDGSGGAVMTVPADSAGVLDSFPQQFGQSSDLLAWLQPGEPFDISVEALLSPTDTSGIRSETVSVTGCGSPTITARKPGGPFAICSGGREDDGSGNCVCPAGTEENSSGECVTPPGGNGNGNGNTQQPTFRVDTSGGNKSSPTLGELGLLLSGIALAGAAAPALRRRERKERKQS